MVKIDLTMGHRFMQKELVKMGVITQKEMDEEIINVGYGQDGGKVDIEPDVIMDFRHLDIPDESCSLVLFDPPFWYNKWVKHHDYSGSVVDTNINHGQIVECYGSFKDREEMTLSLYLAFREIYRILIFGGVCIFKWSEGTSDLSKILSLIGLLKVDRKEIRASKGDKGSKTNITVHVWLKK